MRLASEHPLRKELHNELHARPSLYFDGNTDVWHIAVVSNAGALPLVPGVGGLEDAKTTGQGSHGIGRLGDGQLKWETHTEFVTLTYATASLSDLGQAPPQPFQELLRGIEGSVIAAARVLVRQDIGQAPALRPEGDYVASKIGGGDAEVQSNFRLSDSGFGEFLVFNKKLNAYRTGRMVRRLLEIDTYRMMALLGVPTASETLARIRQYDDRLAVLVEHMQTAAKVDKALLSDVTNLSSEVLNFSAVAKRRFGATRAYADIVASRMAELREDRVEERQRFCTFVDRRFQPAIRSVIAAERRLDELSGRVALAGDLLRTTVQVQLEDQNASLLTSMEQRARAQVHIQQAVEGFSVIAISYYAVGLAKICLESAVGLGLDPHAAKITALVAVPIFMFAVWRLVHHVRKTISRAGDGQGGAVRL